MGRGKPRKKRKNAKARYDKEYPVVPIRLHKNTKKQLMKEAEKKNLMLSQYIRDLLQGTEIRERIVERAVEKPVIKTVVETIENPAKEEQIRELTRALKSERDRSSSQRAELAKISKKLSDQRKETSSLREPLSSLSEKFNALEKKGEAELQRSQARMRQAQERLERVQAQTRELSSLNSKLQRQLEWALEELRTNDSRNKAIAQKIADTYGIRVFFVRTSWDEMP